MKRHLLPVFFLCLLFLIACGDGSSSAKSDADKIDGNDIDTEQSDSSTDEEKDGDSKADKDPDSDDADVDGKTDDKDQTKPDDDIVNDGLDDSFLSPNNGLAYKMVTKISWDIGNIIEPTVLKAEFPLENGEKVVFKSSGAHAMAGTTKMNVILESEQAVDGTKYTVRTVLPNDNLKALTVAGENSFTTDGNFYYTEVTKYEVKNNTVVACPTHLNPMPNKKDELFVLSEGMKWIGEETLGLMINTRLTTNKRVIADAYNTPFYKNTCICMDSGATDPRDCTFEEAGETPPECLKHSDCADNAEGKTACNLDMSSDSRFTCIKPIEVETCEADTDCEKNTNEKTKCDLQSVSDTYKKCVKPNEICRTLTVGNFTATKLTNVEGYYYKAKVEPNVGEDQETETGKVLPDYLYIEFYGNDYSTASTFDLGDAEHSDYQATDEAIVLRENQGPSFYGDSYFQAEGELKLENVQLDFGKKSMTARSKGSVKNLKLLQVLEADSTEAPKCYWILDASWDTTVDPVCGNGKIEDNETCDDGNKTAGDGCSDACAVETDYVCTGEPSACLEKVDPCAGVTCSNHGTCEVENNSAVCVCDDGYGSKDDKTVCLLTGNSCDAPMIKVDSTGEYTFTATAAKGYTNEHTPSCSTGYESSVDYIFELSLEKRSDVVLEITNFETDGNYPDTVMYLSSTCGSSDLACNDDIALQNSLSKIETTLDAGTYYVVLDTFTKAEGTYTVKADINDVATGPVCGNGVIETGETCDDKNTTDADGCSSACAVEADYECSGTPSTCNKKIVCGNGIVETGETCDDKNTADADGCSSTCAVEADYECSGEPSTCNKKIVCGDGKVEGDEKCDDGNTVDGDGCSATCTIETPVDPCENVTCAANATCKNQEGNGVCVCDDGFKMNDEGDTCVLMGNTCDSPMENIMTSGTYTFTATEAKGFTGNFAPPAECLPYPDTPSSFDYVFSLTIDKKAKVIIDVTAFQTSGYYPDTVIYLSSTCGDADIACNDDKAERDALSKISKNLEAGTYYVVLDSTYTDSGSYTVDITITDPDPDPVCGNGKIEEGEACDDGNIDAEDGCSDSCELEAGFICSGEPTTCITEASLCENVTCSDKGTCRVVEAKPYCDCEPGYGVTTDKTVCLPHPELVINEVDYDQYTTTSSPIDSKQFIEIYNKSAEPADLTDIKIFYVDNATNTSYYTVPLTGTIPAKGYMLLYRGSKWYSSEINNLNCETKKVYEDMKSGAAGIVLAKVAGKRADVLDSFSYRACITGATLEGVDGTFDVCETAMSPSDSNMYGASISRIEDGYDTDNNKHDFRFVTPTTPCAPNKVAANDAYTFINGNFESDVETLTSKPYKLFEGWAPYYFSTVSTGDEAGNKYYNVECKSSKRNPAVFQTYFKMGADAPNSITFRAKGSGTMLFLLSTNDGDRYYKLDAATGSFNYAEGVDYNTVDAYIDFNNAEWKTYTINLGSELDELIKNGEIMTLTLHHKIDVQLSAGFDDFVIVK